MEMIKELAALIACFFLGVGLNKFYRYWKGKCRK